MWAKHLIADMSQGDRARVGSPEHIRRFVDLLLGAIGAKAHGPILLKRVAEHKPEVAGYALVQLIEASAITGHFCYHSGDAYIDILSCEDFEVELALEVARGIFRPKHIKFMTLVRQALPPLALSTAS